MAVSVALVIVIAMLVQSRMDSRANELEGRIPYWRVESVVKGAGGEVAILCGSEFGWVSKSDVVAPNQGTSVLVSVLEPSNPNIPPRLVAPVGNAKANLLSALPLCNVADFYQYIPR